MISLFMEIVRICKNSLWKQYTWVRWLSLSVRSVGTTDKFIMRHDVSLEHPTCVIHHLEARKRPEQVSIKLVFNLRMSAISGAQNTVQLAPLTFRLYEIETLSAIEPNRMQTTVVQSNSESPVTVTRSIPMQVTEIRKNKITLLAKSQKNDWGLNAVTATKMMLSMGISKMYHTPP